MIRRRKPGSKILGALLPIVLLPLLAVTGFIAWIVYGAVHPPARPYLVTPEKFTLLSDRGLRATDETWTNRDGTQARGWLLRGGQGQPAIVLLHRYGADRSYLLNLGVKINETSNYTVLWPDLRGHGENPSVGRTSLGTSEVEDTLAAIDFLRSQKTLQAQPLVGAVGLYGVEMGAYAALIAVARNEQLATALILDSIPNVPDDLLRSAIKNRVGFDTALVYHLTRGAARFYFLGGYSNATACQAASSVRSPHVLLLSGTEAGALRDSTARLAACFPNPANIKVNTDLPLSGFNLASATGQQGETYDRLVIDFFDRTLR